MRIGPPRPDSVVYAQLAHSRATAHIPSDVVDTARVNVSHRRPITRRSSQVPSFVVGAPFCQARVWSGRYRAAHAAGLERCSRTPVRHEQGAPASARASQRAYTRAAVART